MGFIEYFNVAKDISRGFDHQKHELKYHDADMRKKTWWDQHSLKGFAKSVGSFVEGVTGGEDLQNMDTKEEKNLAATGVGKYQAWDPANIHYVY